MNALITFSYKTIIIIASLFIGLAISVLIGISLILELIRYVIDFILSINNKFTLGLLDMIISTLDELIKRGE